MSLVNTVRQNVRGSLSDQELDSIELRDRAAWDVLGFSKLMTEDTNNLIPNAGLRNAMVAAASAGTNTDMIAIDKPSFSVTNTIDCSFVNGGLTSNLVTGVEEAYTTGFSVSKPINENNEISMQEEFITMIDKAVEAVMLDVEAASAAYFVGARATDNAWNTTGVSAQFGYTSVGDAVQSAIGATTGLTTTLKEIPSMIAQLDLGNDINMVIRSITGAFKYATSKSGALYERVQGVTDADETYLFEPYDMYLSNKSGITTPVGIKNELWVSTPSNFAMQSFLDRAFLEREKVMSTGIAFETFTDPRYPNFEFGLKTTDNCQTPIVDGASKTRVGVGYQYTIIARIIRNKAYNSDPANEVGGVFEFDVPIS